ncbi:DUF732 domain-containing protein [Planomonospora algeriensis]
MTLTEQEIAYLKERGNEPDASGTITFDPDLLTEGHQICGRESGEDDYVGDFIGPPTVQALIEETTSGAGDPDAFKAAITHLCPKYLPVWRKAQGGFTDGTYEVGKDIKAGTYRTTPGSVTDCYWERSTGGGSTIANDFVRNAPRGVRVTVQRGEGFTSEGCGIWMRA